MLQISNQGISNSFLLPVRIDNNLEKTMMGDFFVRHQKKSSHSTWDVIDRCSDAAAPSTKADPALKCIFDFFFFRHRKPFEHAGAFDPLAQITDVSHISVSNVQTRDLLH